MSDGLATAANAGVEAMTAQPEDGGHAAAQDRFVAPDQASAFCDSLAETVDALIKVLDEESRLVRTAKLTDAAVLHAKKSALSAKYGGQLSVLKQNAGNMRDLTPEGVERLRGRQLALEEALQANMTVLATARTVSETLIRGIASDASERKGGPSVYGADARSGQKTTSNGSAIRVNTAI
ncbi:MAG: hypothetical protein R3D43_00240 [Tepidamorphaceae bacterium]